LQRWSDVGEGGGKDTSEEIALTAGGSIRSVPTMLWLVEEAAGDDRRGRRLEGFGGRTKLLPYLENQSTISLRERQSDRPNHAGELGRQAMGLSLTAKW
jgi:hypothetical protein